MEKLSDRKAAEQAREAAVAECAADFERLINKMKARGIRLIITQEADHCDETYLKVSTKLSLMADGSIDITDVFVSEKGLHGDKGKPFIYNMMDVYELLRCHLITRWTDFFMKWDPALLEIAKTGDNEGIMEDLKHYMKGLRNIMKQSKKKQRKTKSPPT